jgi:hypothetical protein
MSVRLDRFAEIYILEGRDLAGCNLVECPRAALKIFTIKLDCGNYCLNKLRVSSDLIYL